MIFEHTIRLSEAALVSLLVQVKRYNLEFGTSLTAEEWLDLHVHEICIQQDMQIEVERMKKASDESLAVAVEQKKQEMLAATTPDANPPDK